MPDLSERADLVEIAATVKHHTPPPNGALLIDDGDREVWIPWALIANADEIQTAIEETVMGAEVQVEIPERIASEKGLI